VKRDTAASCGMQPAGATFLPRETTGERAERIEVPFKSAKE